MIVEWGTSQTPEVRLRHLVFIGSRIEGGERGFGKCVTIGMVRDGELTGAAVFHNWSPEAGVIEVSGAGHRWLSRHVLEELFGYIFNTAGCQLAVFRVAEDNKQENGRGIQRVLKAYGFEAYRIPRLAGRDRAEVIFTLTDDAWRSNGFHKSLPVSPGAHETAASLKAA